jgi:hypothetical protein
MGEEWSIAIKDGYWSDCVGEAKPFDVPTAGQNDHALNQVIMSAVTCIYLQIFVGKPDPLVLAFTFNKAKLRFFVVSGVEVGNVWSIEYYHVNDRDLDISIVSQCVHAKTLGKALRIRKDLPDFGSLKRAKEQSRKRVTWWITKDMRTKRSRSSVGESSRPSNRSRSDGEGNPGPNPDGGKQGRVEESGGQDDVEQTENQEGSGGKEKGKGKGKGKGAERVHSTLANVMRKFGQISVSVLNEPLSYG